MFLRYAKTCSQISSQGCLLGLTHWMPHPSKLVPPNLSGSLFSDKIRFSVTRKRGVELKGVLRSKRFAQFCRILLKVDIVCRPFMHNKPHKHAQVHAIPPLITPLLGCNSLGLGLFLTAIFPKVFAGSFQDSVSTSHALALLKAQLGEPFLDILMFFYFCFSPKPALKFPRPALQTPKPALTVNGEIVL